MRNVYGVGINDYYGNVYICGKPIKSYEVWKQMLRRCYSKEYQEKYPTYVGCSVCNEWLHFSKFKEWFDKNYRYELCDSVYRLELDKDILVDNNKVYSPDNCVFLPNKINTFIANKNRKNSSGYTGVSWHKRLKKWTSYISDFDSYKLIHLGVYESIIDAKNAYIKARAVEAEKAKEYLRKLGYNEDIVNKIK